MEPICWSADGIIQGMRHREHPVWGVQFHPESIASQWGHRMLANFLKMAGFNGTPIQPIEMIESRLRSPELDQPKAAIAVGAG